MRLKLKVTENEFELSLPQKLADQLHATDGDEIIVEAASNGAVLVLDPAKVERQVDIGLAIMARYDKTLRDLA